MKFCILLLAIIVAVAEVKSDFKEDMEEIDEACREETNISRKDVDKFFNGAANGEPSDAIKCHIKCFMEKQGRWKNGGFDSAATMQQLQLELKHQQDKVNKLIENCKDKEGTTECDTAYLITKCIIDTYDGAM